MLRNEPFGKSPLPYRPVPRRGHYPPRLSLGFAIRKEVAEFRRVALKEELADAWETNHTMCFFELTALVLGHLHKLCGLPPTEGMTSKCNPFAGRDRRDRARVELRLVDSRGEAGRRHRCYQRALQPPQRRKAEVVSRKRCRPQRAGRVSPSE